MKILNRKIRLREQEESATATIQKAVTNAKNNASGKDTESLSSLDNNSSNDTPNVTFNANSPTVTQDVQNFAKQAANMPSMKGATVTFKESKKPLVVSESIDFTKAELAQFLRSI